MINLKYYGLHLKKFMDPISLFITMVETKLQGMAGEPTSYQHKYLYLAKILENTSHNHFMMQEIQ
jgi:hypothetical protein